MTRTEATAQQLCETIAWVHESIRGEPLDPRDVWRMSSTGEVWPIVDLYEFAERWLLDGLPPRQP